MMLPAIHQVLDKLSAEASQQIVLPLGYVLGHAVTEHPKDLYIPEDALKVVLESFSGPMDLLLYLIQRERVHIIDLPIVPITEQYMAYIGLMDELKQTP